MAYYQFIVEESSEVPWLGYCHQKLGELPSMMRISNLKVNTISKILTTLNAVDVYEDLVMRSLNKVQTLCRMYRVRNQFMLLHVLPTYFHATLYYAIKNTDMALATAKYLNQFKLVSRSKPTINVIRRTEAGFDLLEMEIKRKDLDIDLYYLPDFKPKYDYLLKRLRKKDDSGLVVLHGAPGTGKTMLIRHLVSKVLGKRFIFLPGNMAEELASPHFINLLYTYPNSILIIEEAENILRSRASDAHNSAIANILNITDGLLKDCLHFQIICTFNCSLDQIDPALLRRGRLILQHEFTPLPSEQVKRISKHHAIGLNDHQPMALADIFNREEPGASSQARTQIGFQ